LELPTAQNTSAVVTKKDTSSIKRLRKAGLVILALFVSFYQSEMGILVKMGNLLMYWVSWELAFGIGGWTWTNFSKREKDKKGTKLDQYLALFEVLQTILGDLYSLILIFCFTTLFHKFMTILF
jgi:hypothetical protein